MIKLSIILIIIIIDWSFGQSIHGHNHPHRSLNYSPCPSCLDERLIQHYRVRKCRPIIPGGCSCPSRFNCNNNNNNDVGKNNKSNNIRNIRFMDSTIHNNDSNQEIYGRSFETKLDYYTKCHYNGNHYTIGQIVPTDNACRICVCSFMSDGTIDVDCPSKIECPTSNDDTKMNSNNQGYFTPIMLIGNNGGGPQSIQRYRRRPSRRQSNSEPQSMSSVLSSLSLYCYDYYQHDQCCPRQECIPINSRTGRTLRPRKTCRFVGKEYQLGEKIHLSDIIVHQQKIANLSESDQLDIDENRIEYDNNDDRQRKLAETIACMRCICTENWNNSAIEMNPDQLSELLSADQISCRRKSCILDLDPRFRRGCIPVYDTDKCCPVDFICPRTRQMALRVRGIDYGSKLCHFEGRKYPVGARIYQSQHQAADCIDCECRIPPEFTCLRRKNCQSTNTRK
uniref:Uncharacterized protein LOC113789138 n=1 Tax=Dermatophagoides pteronyssinus TaxID=6956 RepID=A0A6P6XNT9_DERPT|nr:uncharacterized protein LOC113789138 [Dermatophagoides pteronyssinus]